MVVGVAGNDNASQRQSITMCSLGRHGMAVMSANSDRMLHVAVVVVVLL